MVENRKIIFEKGRILNSDMMKELQKGSKDYLEIKYYSYPDGIIEGLDFRYSKKEDLILTPGIVKHKGELYILRNEIVIKTREEFETDRIEGEAVISLIPQAVREEKNIEIKELKLEISAEGETGIFLGRFIERVNIPPYLDYRKIENLQDKTYLDIRKRIYSTADGRGVTPILGRLMAEELMKKTTLVPAEIIILNRGLDYRPVSLKFLSIYLDEGDIESFTYEEITDRAIKKLKKKEEPKQKPAEKKANESEVRSYYSERNF